MSANELKEKNFSESISSFERKVERTIAIKTVLKETRCHPD